MLEAVLVLAVVGVLRSALIANLLLLICWCIYETMYIQIYDFVFPPAVLVVVGVFCSCIYIYIYIFFVFAPAVLEVFGVLCSILCIYYIHMLLSPLYIIYICCCPPSPSPLQPAVLAVVGV